MAVHRDPRSRQRIQEVYGRRAQLHPRGYYSAFDPGHLYLQQTRERALLAALAREGLAELRGIRLLDVGCGGAADLVRFRTYGGRAEDLFGVELQFAFARSARREWGWPRVAQADAACLPFPDASFDVVHQSTVITLLPPGEPRRRAAAEMLRVLRPGGFLLWLDMRYSNPRNPDMRGIGRRELRALFPGCRMRLRSVSLLPGLARRLARWSPLGCALLERVPPLRIHVLAVIRPPGGGRRVAMPPSGG